MSKFLENHHGGTENLLGCNSLSLALQMLLTSKDFPKMKSSSKIFGTSHLALHACLALLWLCELRLSNSADTLSVGQSMRDWQVLESPNKRFQLIFFNPVFSDNRYLGVRFVGRFRNTKEVWVANRESPLNDTSGYLNITQDGYLAIGDESGTSTIINQGNPAMGSNASVTLLDSGNLVLRSGERVVWQSFDHPTDTILPEMKIGLFELNRKQPRKRFLTSWLSPGVPVAGAFTLGVFPGSTKQLEVRRRGVPIWRSSLGTSAIRIFKFMYTSNENESYYSYRNLPAFSTYSWIEMNSTGSINYSLESDNMAESGSLVYCDQKPQYSSEGCIEQQWPKCDADEFAQIFGGMDSWEFNTNFSMGPSDCDEECRNNCNCTAYGSWSLHGLGCKFSYGQQRTDVRIEYSESFYIRNSTAQNDTRTEPHVGRDITKSLNDPAVSLSSKKESSIKKRVWVIVVATLAPLCLAFSLSYLIWKCYFHKASEIGSRRTEVGKDTEKFMHDLGTNITTEDESAIRSLMLKGRKDHELPLFSFSSIETATQHFSEANKLGQGGFGPVYKGTLEDGNEVAIKRLSERSGQGEEEFKNEVVLISKVQHKNLVRLFGCCIKGVEKLLVYEYLPNKSLDTFIFDETKRGLLNWRMRLYIIEGIAQGLLYLHKYSRLKIIHRDLKTSNILLDNNMSPKISDFGTAKIFGEDESRANTNRIVGTFGYMSPEYAMDGLFSAKSDVFSFGVMILEIISGKKNTGFYQSDRSLSLVRHAWNLWKEGKDLELMDTMLEETCPPNEFTRSVQIALLCVQENAEDRPTMSDVVSMFGSESIILSEPKQFSFSTFLRESENASPSNSIADSNPSDYTT